MKRTKDYTLHLLFICFLLALMGSMVSCNDKPEVIRQCENINNNPLILIADETYFRGMDNEYDFEIITYNPEIATALMPVKWVQIVSEDDAIQLQFSGDSYLQVETIIDSFNK